MSKISILPKGTTIKFGKARCVFTEAWFTVLDMLDKTTEREQLDDSTVRKLRRKAEKVFASECSAYEEEDATRGGSNKKFFKHVMETGTTADKAAALTLHIQEAPLHRLRTLNQLMMMTTSHDFRKVSSSIETLKELFLVTLLPENRPLRHFNDAVRVRGDDESKEAFELCLMMWLFEDALKIHYLAFVTALATTCTSKVSHFSKQALVHAHTLLMKRPENEQLLLKIVVARLADKEITMASKAMYLIHTLLAEHPMMAIPVAAEVELIALQANATPRTHFFAATCCAQIRYTHNQVELPRRMIQLYLRLFGAVAVHDIDVRGRTLAALLSGINRALPFSKAELSEELDAQIGHLLRIATAASLNVSVQAMSVLLQVAKARGGDFADRFYRVLYAKILSRELPRSKRKGAVLNLLFRAMADDKHAERVCAFVKRILQLCLVGDAAFAAAGLFLVSETMKKHRLIRRMITEEPRVERDIGEKPWKKQKAEEAEAEHELQLEGLENSNDEEEEEEEEGKEEEKSLEESADVDDSEDDGIAAAAKVAPVVDASTNPDPFLMYDPLKQDPRFARAPLSGAFELTILVQHAHPSVRAFAETLLNGQTVQYRGNPLEDFQLISFLDRFVFRNPKKAKSLDPANRGAVLALRRPRRFLSSMSVDSARFLEKKNVAPHDRFFKHYFEQRAKVMGTPVQREKSQPFDIDSVEVDRFLDELERKFPGAGAGGGFEDAAMDYDDDEANDIELPEFDYDDLDETAFVDEGEGDEDSFGTGGSAFADADEFDIMLDKEVTKGKKMSDAWEEKASAGAFADKRRQQKRRR